MQQEQSTMKTLSPIKPTKTLVKKVVKSIDGALCYGAGSGKGQNVCVMQAIARAIGFSTNDDHVTECVGFAVSAFNRKLNDCSWSTPQARAEGMKELAVASIGSNQIDQKAFGELMLLKGTQNLLPFVFREIAKIKPAGEYKDNLNKHADLCEAVKTFEEAKNAGKDASAYAYASAYADASAYAYADAYAYAYAYAYADAYAYASAYADFKQAKFGKENRLLLLTAEVGVECLKELKSPGCKWISLCK